MNTKTILTIWLCAVLLGATVTFIVVDREAKELRKKSTRNASVPVRAAQGKTDESCEPDAQQVVKPAVNSHPEVHPVSSENSVQDFEMIDKGLRLYPKAGRLEVDGKISVQRGLVELVVSGAEGKDYESIIVVECRADMFHSGLLLLGLNDKEKYGGGGPRSRGDSTPPVGDRVEVSARWKNDKGEEVVFRAEDLVYNRRTNTPMARAGFVFSGSQFESEIDPDTGKPTGREVYMANVYKIFVATLHDPTAILDTPLADGGNDEVFYANESVLPPPGTDVVLIVKVPTEAEKREMLKNEKAE